VIRNQKSDFLSCQKPEMSLFERSAISNEKSASLSGQQSEISYEKSDFTGINKPIKLIIKKLKSKGRV